jgi:hypothetical protein
LPYALIDAVSAGKEGRLTCFWSVLIFIKHGYYFAKSSQVSTLPKAKSKTRSKQNKDMHKCRSVYSERGVPLPVLTSGGEWVGVRTCKNATRVPPSLCDVTQTSDPANPPPCACRTRLRDVCSTRPLPTVGPEPLHPHVCGPHIALEVGDHLMLFTDR